MDLKFGIWASIAGIIALFFFIFIGASVLQAVLDVFGVRL